MVTEIGKLYRVIYKPTIYMYDRIGYLRSIDNKSISFWCDENKDEFFSFKLKFLISYKLI